MSLENIFYHKLTLFYKKKYNVVLQSGMDCAHDMCWEVVCPMIVSLLVMCEDVGVSLGKYWLKINVFLIFI